MLCLLARRQGAARLETANMRRLGGDSRCVGGQLESGKRPFEIGDALRDAIRALVGDACLSVELVEPAQPGGRCVLDGRLLFGLGHRTVVTGLGFCLLLGYVSAVADSGI